MSDAVNKPAHYNQGPIECIDAMQQILTPEEFRGFLKGNAFKYLWREKGKNGIEDLRKGKDYYDRLIQSFDESEDQPGVKQSSTTEPPDGWRWIEVGETLRRGDTTNTIDEIPEDWIGIKCAVKHNLLRRNKFEVGEKVVHVPSKDILEVVEVVEVAGEVKVADIRGSVSRYYPEVLAPYIEDAK